MGTRRASSFPDGIVARTDRLTIRELTFDDVDALFEILGDAIAMEHYPAPKTRA